MSRTIYAPKHGTAEWRKTRAWGLSTYFRLGKVKFPMGVVHFFNETGLFPEPDISEIPVETIAARLIDYGFTKNQTQALIALLTGDADVFDLLDWKNEFADLAISMRHDEIQNTHWRARWLGEPSTRYDA